MQQITLEEAVTHLPELVQEGRGGQQTVFMEGPQPVARLLPIATDAPDPLPG